MIEFKRTSNNIDNYYLKLSDLTLWFKIPNGLLSESEEVKASNIVFTTGINCFTLQDIKDSQKNKRVAELKEELDKLGYDIVKKEG